MQAHIHTYGYHITAHAYSALLLVYQCYITVTYSMYEPLIQHITTTALQQQTSALLCMGYVL